MATLIGTASHIEGIVRAVNSETQETRTLNIGDPVFVGEQLITSDDGSILINMNNGGELTLGRRTQMLLDDDVFSSLSIDAGTEAVINDIATLQQAVLEGNFEDLEETAAGDLGSLGAASEGGIEIARTAAEGNVDKGSFGTNVHAQAISDVLVNRFSDLLEGETGAQGQARAVEEDNSGQNPNVQNSTATEVTLDTPFDDINNLPDIGGTRMGSVHEDSGQFLIANGTLTIADADEGEAFFTAETIMGKFGSITIDSNGNWTYTADNAQDVIQALGEGDTLIDSIIVTTADGTTHEILITIYGTNDAAVISGEDTGTVTEDSASLLSATGRLNISDDDYGDAEFTPGILAGNYGSLNIGSAGNWSYSADNNQAAIQALGAGDSLTEIITITTLDGTTHNIEITIQGTNDLPEIGGVRTGAVDAADAGILTASGALTITDVDTGEAAFTAGTVDGNYGYVTMGSDGNWTYSASSNQADILALGEGDTLIDSIFVTAVDGTPHEILITILGTNDAAVIGGEDTGSVTEDVAALLSATGTLTIADPDFGESEFTPEVITGDYGSLNIGSAGNWSYSADNTQAAIQTLSAGDTLTETITVSSLDGTTHSIEITINGTNDLPVIGGVNTGAVTEDTAGTLTTSGALTITDVDSGEAVFTTGDFAGLYGSVAMSADGNWTYTADNSQTAISSLGDGDTLIDSIMVTTADGTEQEILITINGSNDVAVITGSDTGEVIEGAALILTSTGNLAISDEDAGQEEFSAETIVGTYGELTIDSAGGWIYIADNEQAAIQSLGEGDTQTETFTISSVDGTTHDLVMTITGTNDVAVIAGLDTGVLTEDVAVDDVLSVSGALTITDTDAGEAAFNAGTLNGLYGDLSIDADGNWSYTADNTQLAIQQLDGNEDFLIDTITVTSLDGTEQEILITINGANDAAVITGDTTGALTEEDAATLTTTGKLDVTDIDLGEAEFQDGAVAGTHGVVTIDSIGNWSYSVSNDLAAIQQLGAGDTLVDTITVQSLDGTTTNIEITITGTNDVAVIGGVRTGTVTEDNDVTADTISVSGALTITDVDAGEASFTAETVAGTYGSVAMNADGSWTYSADNTQTAIQQLGATDSLVDTMTVRSVDGTTHTIEININGTNDIATFTGDDTGALTEEDAGLLTATGKLNVTDVDLGESDFQNGDVTGSYGVLTIDSLGNWSYSADNNQAAIQQLGAGDTLTENITVKSTDGTEKTIVITITGTNDAAVIGGVRTGTVTEDTDVTSDTISVTGALTITDVDTDEATFTAETVAGTYGSVAMNADGTWTYSADNTSIAIQQLSATDSLVDTMTVTSVDGTTHTIEINIDGTNDIAVIAGDTTGALTEDFAGLLTATGTLTISDTDLGQEEFTDITVGAPLVGTYGSLVLDSIGNWSYSADNNQAVIQQLGAGDTLTETLTVASVDGTEQDIVITITGTNDVPVITGDSTGSVTEDTAATLTISGALAITDVDAGEASFNANILSGTYGSVTIDAGGNWTYSVDNSLAAIQALNTGESLSDTITVTTADGTTKDIIITIHGDDENVAPTLTLDATATMNADGGSVNLNFTAVDTDGTIASTTASVDPAKGSIVVNGDGTITFTPVDGFLGDAVVTVTTTDNEGATDVQTATVTVNAAPAGDTNLTFTVSLDSYAESIGTAATAGSVTDLGAGYGNETSVDIATNWGGGTYTSGDTNETITGGTGYTTIDSAGGDDNIIITAANNLNIISGTGDDRVEMTGSYGGSNTITTGDGNDRIVDSSTGTRLGMVIDTGTGHDYVDMAAGDSQIVTLGSGNDEVIAEDGHNTIIDAGTGDDKVTLTGYGTALDITTGDGNDQVINASGTLDHSYTTVDTGAGDDSVQMMKGTDIQYNLGSGNDTIENLWAYTENIVRGQLIDGGTGADTLILNGNSFDYHVTDNGDGTYTVQPVHETFRYNDLTITNIEHIQYLDKTVDVGSDTSDGVFEYDMTLNAGSAVGTDTFSSITLTNVPAGATITGATDNGDGTFTVLVDANADASITIVSTSALSSTDLNSMVATITATSVDTTTENISASLDVTVNIGVAATAPVVTMSISQATVAQGLINTSATDLGAGYGNENTIDSMIYSTSAWDDRIVNGTDQNDTINVIQGMRQTVSSGDGDDLIITADNENISSLNLDTGAGSDRVVLASNAQRADNVINTGTGNDRVEIANDLDNVWADRMQINTGAGDDYVEHSAGREMVVNLGEGNDTYSKTSAALTTVGTIDYDEVEEGGSSADIIYDMNGDAQLLTYNLIDGGAGIDTFVINGNSTDYRITARADGTYEIAETMGNTWDSGRFSVLIQNFEHVQFTGDATTIDVDTFTAQNFQYDVVLHTELTDVDGSETLSDLSLGNVPASVVVLNAAGDQIHPDGSGNYIITPDVNGDITVTLVSYAPLTTDELNAITSSATSTETANGLTATTTVTAPVVYNEVAISDETGVTNGNLLDNVDAGSTLDSIVYNGTTYNAADYAAGLTINTLSGGTLALDFTTGTYTSTGTGTDETFTLNATDSQSNAVSFTFDANDIAGVDAGILYGDNTAAEQFNIETGHDTTIVDFDYANDVLDLSEVITGPVDVGTLSNYLDFTFGGTDTDGDGNMDLTAIIVDADAGTTDDITTIYIQDGQFDTDDIDDLKIDYQDN